MQRVSDFDNSNGYIILKCAKFHNFIAEDLIEIAEPYLVTICRNFTLDKDKLEEYLQEAKLAFLRAVDTFDETRGVKFLTYMVRVVRNELIKFVYLKDGDFLMHYPVKKQMIKVNQNDFEENLVYDIEEAYLTEECMKYLFEKLNKKEREFVRFYFGVNNKGKLSKKCLCAKMGLSEDRFNSLLVDVKRKMRKALILWYKGGKLV